MPRQKGLLRACSYVYQSLAAVASATLIAGNDLCLGVEPADFHPWGGPRSRGRPRARFRAVFVWGREVTVSGPPLHGDHERAAFACTASRIMRAKTTFGLCSAQHLATN